MRREKESWRYNEPAFFGLAVKRGRKLGKGSNLAVSHESVKYGVVLFTAVKNLNHI